MRSCNHFTCELTAPWRQFQIPETSISNPDLASGWTSEALEWEIFYSFAASSLPKCFFCGGILEGHPLHAGCFACCPTLRSWERKRLEGVATGLREDVSGRSPPTATAPPSDEPLCSATHFHPGRQNDWAHGNVLFRFSQREGPHSVLWNNFYSKWHD